MPELPEVEGVVRELRLRLPGRSIRHAETFRDRLIAPLPSAEFAAALTGATIGDVGRRGKHILIHLGTGQTLVVHLRMSGRFLYVDDETPLPKFVHALFHLDNGKRLAFQDQRHFAIMRLADTATLGKMKELRDLAPEPLGDDFTPAYLARALAKTKRSLKEALLDQTLVLGLGNIYAAEALFAAPHPEMAASDVPKSKISDLHDIIRMILEAAIEAGSTIDTNPENIDGGYFGASFEEALVVYDREGEPCVRCETPIARIRQGQRSTYFCPKCQKLKPIRAVRT